MRVAHCGLTRTRWRHNGQCGGGNDTGSTPRPDTQPLDGNTTGSAVAVATWAAHHGPTRRGQHGGGGDAGSTLWPDTHSMATRQAAQRRRRCRQHTMARHAGGSMAAVTWAAHHGPTRSRSMATRRAALHSGARGDTRGSSARWRGRQHSEQQRTVMTIAAVVVYTLSLVMPVVKKIKF